LLVVGSLTTIALLLFWPLAVGAPPQAAPRSLAYSSFVSDVAHNQVASVAIASDGTLSGHLRNGQAFISAAPTAVPDTGLLPLLASHHVRVRAVPAGPGWVSVLVSFLPLAFFVGLFAWIGWAVRRNRGGVLGQIMGVGRSRAKVVTPDMPRTTFAEVAGYQGVKAEIAEVVDYLKDPSRWRRVGAKGPRGVLLSGPPGTGKTLLARAVAGEAGVAFFATSGSAFVELYVGVGASRVRDLFAQARSRAPAIVFIDEIDAIGGRRLAGLTAGANDEREQTLNQLLAEMDGFEPGQGVVVLAATNRPEVLDPALLRPGRFDRQITVPLPNLSERAAILGVHCADKRLGADVDLMEIARGTPGFSGADLANLANEAAIVAVRSGREVLASEDFWEARDRVLLGQRLSPNALRPEERHVVAVHEAGHALVAALCPKADPVAKVSILPAGQALGVTEQLPLDERHLYGEGYLHDTLAVRLGGRAAEMLVVGEASSGAANDLASATELATKMVVEFGLSPALGPVGYSSHGPRFLGPDPLERHPYSDRTQRLVDSEVARLLREAEARATDLIRSHREALDALVQLLVDQETVAGEEVYRLVGRPGPPGRAASRPVAVAAGGGALSPAGPGHGHPAAASRGQLHS